MMYTAEQKQALQAYLRFVDGDDRPWDPTLEQRAITEGAWPPFLESLRANARAYVQRGQSFVDWVVEASRMRNQMLQRLHETGADPAKANQITCGLMLVYDLVLETMGRWCVEEKQTLLEDTLRRSEAQLHHVQKMESLGRLAGGVAHDFNNILTVVGSYASMLEESLDPSDERQADAIEIRYAAERATKLTRQLLTLSRQSPVAPRSIDVDELVTSFVPMLRRLLGPGIKLELQLNQPQYVVVDPNQLEQVLMNLAVNARDAMTDQGRVLVETSMVELDGRHGLPPGRFVMVSVTDNGPGIPRDVQKRVFDPFFTTKDVGKGTGLGLSIVHGIVTQASGAIELYSEPDHGTTFRIYLPSSDRRSAGEPEAASETPTLPPVTVLCVEDHREVRELCARVLGAHGCTVLQATTGAEAREICVKHEGGIDVALVDLALSDGRGDVVLRDLRALRPELHVILTSGFPAGALHPTDADPVMVLAKPFSPTRLRDAVATVTAGRTPVRRSEPSLVPRVLLVDDDPSLRKMLGRFLRRNQFEVVEADTGKNALRELGGQRFDVVLSDIHMPDGSGLDLLRGARRTDLDVPVILISGKPDIETAAAALEFGAFRYLSKPLDVEALGKVVRTAVRAHALARLRREALEVGRGSASAIAERAGLEARFDSAIESLWMAYQPIVNASSGASFGVEALMRTREATLPSPPAVLEAAVQLERLPQLGRRIRNLVAAVLEARADVPSAFVNLHPDDLFDAHLIDEAAPLTCHAARVVLEITEREALTSSAALTERLARLRALGFRLAVDDIGAGYSGLTSFTDLMPEIVKIDMSLIRAIHTSKVKQRTVAALCALCHDMGAIVVGEGVETNAERDCLRSLGCDLLQGYLIAKPMAVIA